MQCTGNSGCFPQGKRAAIVRRYPGVILKKNSPVCSVFMFVTCKCNPPTWTTGSLTYVHDHSYACVFRQGLGTPMSLHNILTQKNSQFFLLLQTGYEPLPCVTTANSLQNCFMALQKHFKQWNRLPVFCRRVSDMAAVSVVGLSDRQNNSLFSLF